MSGLGFSETVSVDETFDSGISISSVKESIVSDKEGSDTTLVSEDTLVVSHEEVDGRFLSRIPRHDQDRVDSGYGRCPPGTVSIPKEIWAFIPNDEGDHVLHLAVAQENLPALHGAFEAMKRNPIIQSCINDRNDLGQTPLHIAAHLDLVSIVKELLCEGAELDVVDRNGNTPIHIACTKGHTRTLDAIATIAMKQNIIAAAEKRNTNGMACPHLGALRGDAAVLRWLNHAGVTMDIQESGSGRTALHMVIEKKSLSLLMTLVTELGAEIDVPMYSGYTPLHVASGTDSFDLVATLIAMGADPYAMTDEEETPEDLTQNDEVHKFLRSITSPCDINGVL